jgi:hypothetical protein
LGGASRRGGGYVKNHRQPGFSIPYTVNGEQRDYFPDFIARVDDARMRDPVELLNVVVEVTGEVKKEKEAKAGTARDLWVAAVNNNGGIGRWAFRGDYRSLARQVAAPRCSRAAGRGLTSERFTFTQRQWPSGNVWRAPPESRSPVEAIKHKDRVPQLRKFGVHRGFSCSVPGKAPLIFRMK